ncbi:MAG TPA: L-lactate permease [Chloroflexi bacterium]|nr:L-lactate permease [Chloroflexota bacterium]
MSISLLDWLIALAPIVTILGLMVLWRWSGAHAGAVGWLVALVGATIRFGAGPQLIVYSQVRAFLLSLFVLYIVWSALLLYHVGREAGAIEAISAGVARMTADRLLQLLLLAWVFASFLQGVTGFGVPTAVVAPLLIGLGFQPELAVVATTIGHSWAVTFGSVGSSFYTLLAVTGQPATALARPTALLLGISWLTNGFLVAYLYGRWRAIIRGSGMILVLGATMAGVQYLVATAGAWQISAFIGGFAGLLVAAFLTRWRRPDHATAAGSRVESTPKMSFGVALSAYLVMMLVVLAATFISPLDRILNSVQLNVTFPAVSTSRGWLVAPGPGRAVSVFGHAGALLVYSSVAAATIYARAGYYRPRAVVRIVTATLRDSVGSTLGILAMVGMALIMDNSGMISILAQGLATAFGSSLPLISPIVGALGAFMTGSNTNSNVLFGALQQELAALLGYSAPIILAAQTAGAAMGSNISPTKLIVGASTAGLAGDEGIVLRLAIGYGAILVAVVSLATVCLIYLSAP